MKKKRVMALLLAVLLAAGIAIPAAAAAIRTNIMLPTAAIS